MHARIAPIVAGVLSTVASADIFDPPGEQFHGHSTDSNSGYDDGRGVLFRVTRDVVVTDVGWWNDMPHGSPITFYIWRVEDLDGNLLDGADLISVANTTTGAEGLRAHTTEIEPVTLEAGSAYLLRVKHDVLSKQNWYFHFNNGDFGDPPFYVGDFLVVDGTFAGGMGNTVMARFQINELGCAADFNGDGLVDVLDFVAFQLAWQAGDPSADCDASGTFDVIDFVCFQRLFVLGCE